MKSHLSTDASYNSNQAPLRLKESDVRSKGKQAGSVRQKVKGGPWYIRFSEWREKPDGTWSWSETEKRIEDGGEKINEGRALVLGYEQWVLKANQLNKAPQGVVTLKFFVEHRFIPDVVEGYGRVWGNSARSILKKHILPRFGRMQMSEIRRDMVQDWVNQKSRAGAAPGSVKHYLKILKAIFEHAAAMNIDSMNAAAKIKLPKQTYVERTAYTLDQIRQLADKLRVARKDHCARFLMFLALTGMRRGEALAMRWREVDWTTNVVSVRGTWDGMQLTPGKSRMAKRVVPLVGEAVQILREQLAGTKWNGVDHPVFAADRGSKPRPFNAANALRRTVKPLAVELGMLDFDWHSERHTMATMLDGHATPDQRKSVLGHSSVEMTSRYTHSSVEGIRAAMENSMVVDKKETVQ